MFGKGSVSLFLSASVVPSAHYLPLNPPMSSVGMMSAVTDYIWEVGWSLVIFILGPPVLDSDSSVEVSLVTGGNCDFSPGGVIIASDMPGRSRSFPERNLEPRPAVVVILESTDLRSYRCCITAFLFALRKLR